MLRIEMTVTWDGGGSSKKKLALLLDSSRSCSCLSAYKRDQLTVVVATFATFADAFPSRDLDRRSPRREGSRGGEGGQRSTSLAMSQKAAVTDDLAFQNAPQQVFELIGDPRTGVADDVSRPSPFGEMSVDMIHQQSSNEVYWYKYEFAGGAVKESHRNSRLSDASKNLMYILRAKDPNRWSIDALASKFRIRKQRVLAILALKEMEAHRMEGSKMLGGALSAYACPVHLETVPLDPRTGEPFHFEYDTEEAKRVVLKAGEMQQGKRGDGERRQPGSSSSSGDKDSATTSAMLDEFVAGGAASIPEDDASTASSSSSSAAYRAFHLGQQVRAASVTTQKLQLQMLEVLEPYDFDVAALRTSLMSTQVRTASVTTQKLEPYDFDVAALRTSLMRFKRLSEAVTSNLPAASEDEAASSDDSTATTSSKPAAAIRARLTTMEKSVDVLLSSLEALFANSDVLREEMQLAKSVKHLMGLWHRSLLGQPEGAAPNEETTAALTAALSDGDWHGQKLLKLMLGLPLELRNVIVTGVSSVPVELNALGVDLQALVSSQSYQGPGVERQAVQEVQEGEPVQEKRKRASASSAATSLLPFDIFGFRPASAPSASAAGESPYMLVAKQLGALTTLLNSLSFLSTESDADLSGLVKLLTALNSANGMVSKLRKEEGKGYVMGQGNYGEHMQKLEVANGMIGELRNEEDGGYDMGQGKSGEHMQKLELLHEVDPEYPERVEKYEAVLQLMQRGNAGRDGVHQLLTELEGEGAADHIIKGMTPYDAVEAPSQVAAERAMTDAESELGAHPGSWDLGYSLKEFDSLEEGELSHLNRLVAQKEEDRMGEAFASNLLFNLGLRGEELRDASKRALWANLDSSIARNSMVVYDINEAGQTVYPPRLVVDTKGRQRPLNEQEKVFQERRKATKPVAYQMQRMSSPDGLKNLKTSGLAMVFAPLDLDDHLFSDVRVVFSIGKASGEDGRHVLRNQEDLSFLAHKNILAHSSPVLKTMLLRMAEEQRGEEQQLMSSAMVLEIPVEEEEQLAAEVLLRHMYNGKFAEEVNKHPIAGLLTKCGNQLIIQHPNATSMCKSPPEELEPFLRLTFHAMLALISSDLLKADSENDVLVLACLWVRHNTPSQSQLSLLSQRIRLKHLTPSFLASLNVIAPWVPITPQMLCKLLSLQNCTLDLDQAGPPSWFGPPRASEPSSTEWTTALDWWHVSKLCQAARGQGLGGWASSVMDIRIPAMRVYHKGYYFQAAIDVQYHKKGTPPAPGKFLERRSKFKVVFVLRVSHALDVSGAAKGGKESSDEEAARKEVVADQATWDCDIVHSSLCGGCNASRNRSNNKSKEVQLVAHESKMDACGHAMHCSDCRLGLPAALGDCALEYFWAMLKLTPNRGGGGGGTPKAEAGQAWGSRLY
eukprot:gene59-12878_t